MKKPAKRLIPATVSLKGRLGEVPLAIPSGSFYNCQPKFSLIHIHSKYCLSLCISTEKAAIIDRLHELSRLTWGEIWRNPKEGLGAEPLPDAVYKKMPDELKAKSNKYIVFRFSKKGRIIGFHKHDTFHIVWFDRNHDVCS